MGRLAIAIFAAALVCSGCSQSQDNEAAAETVACANRLYTPYNPKNMKQCVDVCIRCERGVTTTCSTACTLKGAS